MSEQGAVCQARSQEGLEAQPWGRTVSTWGGGWGMENHPEPCPLHIWDSLSGKQMMVAPSWVALPPESTSKEKSLNWLEHSPTQL